MKDTDMDEIIELTEQKQSLIEEFLKLTEQQAEAISQDNYEIILNIISQKQNIIEQVNLLTLDLPNNIPDNDSLQKIDAQTREVMSKAIEIDNKNIELLKNNQAQIFEQLTNVQKNKQTHALYRGKDKGIEGILLDKKT